MKVKLLFLCIILCIFQTVVPKSNITCLTGHKLLTRTMFSTDQQKQPNQTKYKLKYRCLCPNNYFGQQCESHLGIDCYLTPVNNHNNNTYQINSSNIKNEMLTNLEFTVDCYVSDKRDLSLGKIQLRQFLSMNNQANAYGVREQLGNRTEIIWSNDTSLFDNQGELIAQKKSPNLSKLQKDKLLIGNNQKLYQKPFAYQQTFLNYPLINGNISLILEIINPQKGAYQIAKYSQKQVKISGVDDYVDSFVGLSQLERRRQNFVKNISDMIRDGSLNRTVINNNKQMINGSQRSKELSFPTRPSLEKPLPTITIPINLTPYNTTFYQSIRLQISITQTYQQIITHQTSLNSANFIIPVKVEGLGLPQVIRKNLVVTDASSKSYYRILTVVGVVGLVCLGMTVGYRKYKVWKSGQYLVEGSSDSGDYRKESQREKNQKDIQGNSNEADIYCRKKDEESVRSSTSKSAEGYCLKGQENNLYQ